MIFPKKIHFYRACDYTTPADAIIDGALYSMNLNIQVLSIDMIKDVTLIVESVTNVSSECIGGNTQLTAVLEHPINEEEYMTVDYYINFIKPFLK